MRIGELAEMFGVTTDTLRFYEQKGLIRSTRLENGYRDYSEDMLIILSYIQTAQRLGFSLKEIGEEIPGLLEQGISAERIAVIIQQKIAATDIKIKELQSLKNELKKLLQATCPLLPSDERTIGRLENIGLQEEQNEPELRRSS